MIDKLLAHADVAPVKWEALAAVSQRIQGHSTSLHEIENPHRKWKRQRTERETKARWLAELCEAGVRVVTPLDRMSPTLPLVRSNVSVMQRCGRCRHSLPSSCRCSQVPEPPAAAFDVTVVLPAAHDWRGKVIAPGGPMTLKLAPTDTIQAVCERLEMADTAFLPPECVDIPL